MLPTLDAPELVFGLCSPIGTDNAKVSELIQRALLTYRYEAEMFKVTDLMKAIEIQGMELQSKPADRRYDTHIKYANRIRELTELPSALAIMCSTAIRSFRRSKGTQPDAYLTSQAYVFDQFKRREEIEALRQVYGRLFILVSIYSDKDHRLRKLSKRLASDSASSRIDEVHRHAASKLEQRDQEEEDIPSGQRLRETFPLADVFLNIDDLEGARATLDRFLSAFFGSNEVSPTRDEYGMYIAKSAALRSLDLSRQVGAAIFSKTGEVISLGCNEVPKAGGGTYWTGEAGDSRDYKIERDENERIKRGILADVVRRLRDGALITGNKSEEELVNFVLEESLKKGTVIRDAQLMDLIEFGRIIHAEMSAISDAARNGSSTRDSTLYCTTFPCHICAKHIVAAGVRRVLYIEPYPKSYAEDLHQDSIILGADTSTMDKAQFSPFIGISPFRFRELFERGKRKNNSGEYIKWLAEKAKPVVRYTLATYLQNEAAMTKILDEKLRELQDAGTINVVGLD